MLKIPFLKKSKPAPIWLKHINHCQACGLCTNACPLGKLSPIGLYAPRGRIALIRTFFEGRISEAEISTIFSICLHCGQCERACPADLPLQDIFMEFSAFLRSSDKDSLHKVLYLLQFFPSLSTTLQYISAIILRTGIKKKLPSFLRDLPLKPSTVPLKIKNEKFASRGDSNSILLFSGCLARNIDPDIATASMKLIANFSHSLLNPQFVCCGRINRIMGKDNENLALVRKNLKLLANLQYEYILTPCPACTQELAHYWPKIKGLKKEEKELASKISEKVIEPSAFMQKNLQGRGLAQTNQAKAIFFHISCLSPSSVRADIEKIFPASKYLLAENGKNCCGASLLCSRQKDQTNKQFAASLGRKLRDEVLASGAELLLTTCPACKLHLRKILAQNGDSIQVKHIIELYSQIKST